MKMKMDDSSAAAGWLGEKLHQRRRRRQTVMRVGMGMGTFSGDEGGGHQEIRMAQGHWAICLVE